MISRVMVTSKGLSTPGRLIPSVMVEPGSPRIFSTASSSEMPSMLLELIDRIRSPGFMPAFAAGVPSIGEITLISPSSPVTSSPRPPNAPLVCTMKAAYCFSVM